MVLSWKHMVPVQQFSTSPTSGCYTIRHLVRSDLDYNQSTQSFNSWVKKGYWNLSTKWSHSNDIAVNNISHYVETRMIFTQWFGKMLWCTHVFAACLSRNLHSWMRVFKVGVNQCFFRNGIPTLSNLWPQANNPLQCTQYSKHTHAVRLTMARWTADKHELKHARLISIVHFSFGSRQPLSTPFSNKKILANYIFLLNYLISNSCLVDSLTW